MMRVSFQGFDNKASMLHFISAKALKNLKQSSTDEDEIGW